MKALFFPRVNEIEVGQLCKPEVGRGEVLIKLRASGLCHTDIDVMRANYGASAFPLIPGHEFAGEVFSVGDDVTDFKVGDRVVVDPNLECGNCAQCKKGWAHLCETLRAYGVTENGGFAEFCTVQADRLHHIGDLSYEMAALAEPMGCVLNGVSPISDRVIDTAVIFGCGPMGLMMALALKVRGVRKITIVDLDPKRLELAGSMGFSGLLADSDVLISKKGQFDFAVDATGVLSVAEGLIDYVSSGGIVSFFGVCPKDGKIHISPFEVFRRQLTLIGTHSLNHNIPEALQVISEIGPEIERLITHRLSLEDMAAVIRGKKKLSGSLKIQLQL